MDRDTDSDWRKIAEDDPYWGVLSSNKFKTSNMDAQARSEFFSSGQNLMGRILAFIRAHIRRDFAPARSLDFGCGVGRLLIPIARFSSEAVGVDVAPEMLRLAGENLRSFGIANAEVVPSDDELSNVSGSFEFINSYIVIQHIPPSRGYRLIGQLLQRLDKGGVASLQLTYGKHRRFRMHEGARAPYYRREGNALFDLGLEESQHPVGTITMYDYDLNQVFAIVSAYAGSPMLTLPTEDDGHLGLHLVVARR
jgi:SAM-dependent methyltransferase